MNGTSMVKWTTSDPCLVLSESDAKVHTIFKISEEKMYRLLINTLIYEAKQFTMTKTIPRKFYMI